LAKSAGGPIGKVAAFNLKEIQFASVSPVTDLHYSSGMSFGPAYDSTHASQGPYTESSLAYGVDRTAAGWQTDHKKVATFSYLDHAASVLGTVRRLQTPVTDLWAQHAAISTFNTLPSQAALKAPQVGGGAATHGGSAARAGAAARTARAPAAGDEDEDDEDDAMETEGGARAAPASARAPPTTNLPPVQPLPQSMEESLAANADLLRRLLKAKRLRERSQKPWQFEEGECQDSAEVRRNLMTMVRESKEGPGGFISQGYIRELIGAKVKQAALAAEFEEKGLAAFSAVAAVKASRPKHGDKGSGGAASEESPSKRTRIA
jgi:hypothetical protein